MIKDYRTLRNKLKDVVGPDFVFADEDELSAFSIGNKIPRSAALPANMPEAGRLINLADQEGLAVLPRGGGSRIGMLKPPDRLDIVILTNRIDLVHSFDQNNLTITVDAGIKLIELITFLSRRGLTLPIDPPSLERTTVGGTVASNSSGPRRLRYGTVRDWVLGAKFINAKGDLISTGGSAVKNVAGYDISKLLIGSLGAFGLITEVTLRLLPQPESFQALVGFFKNLRDAVAAAMDLQKSAGCPVYLELICKEALHRLNPFPEGKSLIPDHFALAAGCEGKREETFRQMKQAEEAFFAHHAEKVEPFVDGSEHDLDYLLRETATEEENVLVKVAVPIADLEEILDQAESIAGRNELSLCRMAHAGSGIAHFVLRRINSQNDIDTLCRTINDLMEQARKMSGSLTILQAPDEIKKSLSQNGHHDPTRLLLQRLKKELDPQGLFASAL